MPGRLYDYRYGSAAVAIFNFFTRFGTGRIFDRYVIGPGVYVRFGVANGVHGAFVRSARSDAERRQYRDKK